MYFDEISGFGAYGIGHSAFHFCACQATPATTGTRLTSSAGTFAIRDNLSIVTRFCFYDNANILGHLRKPPSLYGLIKKKNRKNTLFSDTYIRYF
jgi:hypothetical protein